MNIEVKSYTTSMGKPVIPVIIGTDRHELTEQEAFKVAQHLLNELQEIDMERHNG